MSEVNIREAEQHMSRLLDVVERGGEVTITRNGKAVARLVPDDSDTNSRQVLKDLASLHERILRERGEKPNPVLIERSESRY